MLSFSDKQPLNQAWHITVDIAPLDAALTNIFSCNDGLTSYVAVQD